MMYAMRRYTAAVALICTIAVNVVMCAAAIPKTSGWVQSDHNFAHSRFSPTTLRIPMELNVLTHLGNSPLGPMVGYGASLYLHSSNKLMNIDLAQRRVMWTMQASRGDYAVATDQGLFAAVRNGDIYLLQKLASRDGKIVEEFGEIDGTSSMLQTSDGSVLVVTADSPQKLFAIDPIPGGKIWTIGLEFGHWTKWIKEDFGPVEIGEIPGAPGLI
jgi:hypothetical protein